MVEKAKDGRPDQGRSGHDNDGDESDQHGVFAERLALFIASVPPKHSPRKIHFVQHRNFESLLSRPPCSVRADKYAQPMKARDWAYR